MTRLFYSFPMVYRESCAPVLMSSSGQKWLILRSVSDGQDKQTHTMENLFPWFNRAFRHFLNVRQRGKEIMFQVLRLAKLTWASWQIADVDNLLAKKHLKITLQLESAREGVLWSDERLSLSRRHKSSGKHSIIDTQDANLKVVCWYILQISNSIWYSVLHTLSRSLLLFRFTIQYYNEACVH